MAQLTAKQAAAQAKSKSAQKLQPGVHSTTRGPIKDPLRPPPSSKAGSKPGPATAAKSTAPSTQATAPSTQAPAPDPYLTPSQMNTYERGYAGQQTSINNDIAGENTSLAKYNSDVAANAQKYSTANDNANWSLGARGLGSSSIRDADLNDLAATYTTQAYNYATSFNSGLAKLSGAVNTAQGNQGLLQGEYNQLAVTNAEALTPATGGSGAVPSNFSFDLGGLTSAALQNTPATTQSQVQNPVTPQSFSVGGTPAADQTGAIGSHIQNMQLGVAQMAATNPSLAAIASQRAGFNPTPTTPMNMKTPTGVPGGTSGAAAPPQA